MITKIMDGPTGSGVISKVFPAHLDAWVKRNPDKPVYVVCNAWQRTTLEHDLQRIGSSVQPRYISTHSKDWRGLLADALLVFYQTPAPRLYREEAYLQTLQAMRTPVWLVGCDVAPDVNPAPRLWIPGKATIYGLKAMLEAAHAD